MPFTDIAPPPAPPPPGTGISFNMMTSGKKKAVTKVRLNLRADIQMQVFGRPVAGQKFSAQVGRGSDEGLLRLVLDDDGDLEAKNSMRGGVFINMAPWDLLPTDKRPSAPCDLKATPSNVEMIIALPSYCKPSGVDGKIAAAHGLKPVPRAK